MKSKLMRIAASLLFGCMVVSSVPAGMVRAEETEAYSEADEQSAEESEQSAGDDKADGTSEESEPEIQEEGTGAEESENIPESGPDNVEDAEDDSAQSEESAESEDSRVPEDEEGDAGTDQAQDDSVIEKNENEINYVFVESPYLETPGTERIAVSFGDGTEQISHISMTVRDEDGKETVWDMAKNAGNVYLFEYEFTDESESGVYEITGLSVSGANGKEVVSLSDSGLEAQFGVNEEYEGIEELQPLDPEEGETASGRSAGTDEQPPVAEVDPEDLEGASEEIAGALKDAENEIGASDKTASADDSASVRMRTASKSMTSSVASIAALGAKIQEVSAESRTGDVVVALDPGHDSTHAGASSNGLKEEVLTLKIAQYCKAELETYSGVTVYMTRTGAACPHPENSSSGGDIGDRVMASVEAGADIYVSIHLNSSTSSAVNGAEVIIPNKNWKPQVAEEGRELAEAILAELQAVGLNLRPDEIYSKDTTIDERYPDGSLSDYFSVQIYAKEAGIPGIIVEHAFLSNSGDRTYLDSDADLKKLGIADATGIAKYLNLSKESKELIKKNNEWFYYKNGVFQSSFTGLEKIEGTWYYIVDGKWKSDYTGLVMYSSGSQYYVKSGKIQHGFTGLIKLNGTWYYIVSGKWRSDYTGLATYSSGSQYYVKSGKIQHSFTGLIKLNVTWYYIAGGRLQSGYTGLVTHTTGSKFYVKSGKMQQSFTGLIKLSGSWYYIENGRWQSEFTGLAPYSSGSKYYVKSGQIQYGFTGLLKLGNTWYYIVDGRWRSDYTGLVAYTSGTKYYVKSGTIQHGFTGLIKLGNSWYYIAGGRWRSDYTGLAMYTVGNWYYVNNGIINYGFNGLVRYGSNTYYVRSGKWQKGFTGAYSVHGTRYSIRNGLVV